MNRDQKFKIEKKLILLQFVEWDRYIESKSSITVFGWIKRKDKYKDFIIIEFDTVNYDINVWNTSSAKFSNIISELIDINNVHNECKRVQYKFNIKNCIRNA